MRKRIFIVVLLGTILGLGCYASLSMSMPGKSHQGALPAMSAEQKVVAANLKKHVDVLATQIGERNVLYKYPELKKTASYIEKEFKALGYTSLSQNFETSRKKVRNIEAIKRGNLLPQEIVVVGAHYDTAENTPGANDNGTGVAGLLELARLFKDKKTDRTVRFVAFVNEEPPWFQTGQMGSVKYAKRCKKRKENIVAMLSLETMGYYTDEPDSQRYPPPISALYPEKGNFVAFAGDTVSEPLVKKCVGLFRKYAKFPSEGAAFPATLTGIGYSDHWSFWQEGYLAVMVTDTAFFRYDHYHQTSDTPDRIDYQKTARVLTGLEQVVLSLSKSEKI